jgi:hypothetical protein
MQTKGARYKKNMYLRVRNSKNGITSYKIEASVIIQTLLFSIEDAPVDQLFPLW